MAATRLSILFNKYILHQCSAEEKQELAILLLDPANETELQGLMDAEWDKERLEKMPQENANNVLASILKESVVEQPQLDESTPLERPRVVRMPWRKIAVAASIILMLGVGSYLFFSKEHAPVKNVASKEETKSSGIESPKISKATITLANGKTVPLDSLHSGVLATEGDVHIIKQEDGKISYSGTAQELASNTLSNPRGSKVVNMKLSDGSEVWLNAGSSITFPVAFVGHERKVSVTGEAYFEIAGNAKMPFKVMKGDVEVKVLGTRFNINSYDDEESIKVTLLQGSVAVAKKNEEHLLKPGQQAVVKDNINIANDVDAAAVMAWKNGKFKFGKKADIKSIMREISRWYDVQIQFEGDVDGHIGGTISRDVNVDTVLNMLETIGSVKFKIEGKKITVRSVSY